MTLLGLEGAMSHPGIPGVFMKVSLFHFKGMGPSLETNENTHTHTLL